MRGPVGSLTTPDNPGDYEALDAGIEGVVVYLHRDMADGRTEVEFQFGLLGRCRLTLG